MSEAEGHVSPALPAKKHRVPIPMFLEADSSCETRTMFWRVQHSFVRPLTEDEGKPCCIAKSMRWYTLRLLSHFWGCWLLLHLRTKLSNYSCSKKLQLACSRTKVQSS